MAQKLTTVLIGCVIVAAIVGRGSNILKILRTSCVNGLLRREKRMENREGGVETIYTLRKPPAACRITGMHRTIKEFRRRRQPKSKPIFARETDSARH